MHNICSVQEQENIRTNILQNASSTDMKDVIAAQGCVIVINILFIYNGLMLG